VARVLPDINPSLIREARVTRVSGDAVERRSVNSKRHTLGNLLREIIAERTLNVSVLRKLQANQDNVFEAARCIERDRRESRTPVKAYRSVLSDPGRRRNAGKLRNLHLLSRHRNPGRPNLAQNHVRVQVVDNIRRPHDRVDSGTRGTLSECSHLVNRGTVKPAVSDTEDTAVIIVKELAIPSLHALHAALRAESNRNPVSRGGFYPLPHRHARGKLLVRLTLESRRGAIGVSATERHGSRRRSRGNLAAVPILRDFKVQRPNTVMQVIKTRTLITGKAFPALKLLNHRVRLADKPIPFLTGLTFLDVSHGVSFSLSGQRAPLKAAAGGTMRRARKPHRKRAECAPKNEGQLFPFTAQLAKRTTC
jgi:hypothetical protein